MIARPCKPDGHPWIVPYLTLPNVDQALAFYERAFGFRAAVVLHGPSGAIDHAEVVWEGGRIMLGPESEEHTARAPMTSQVPSPIAIYVYTDDVVGRYHTAIKEGAEPIEEPAVMPWGDRVAILADPWGYKWTFAQNLADFYSHVEALSSR